MKSFLLRCIRLRHDAVLTVQEELGGRKVACEVHGAPAEEGSAGTSDSLQDSAWQPAPIFKHPSLALAEHSASSFTTHLPAVDTQQAVAPISQSLARTSVMPLPSRKLSVGSRGKGGNDGFQGLSMQRPFSTASTSGVILKPVLSAPTAGSTISLPMQLSLTSSIRRVASMLVRMPGASGNNPVTDASSGSTSTGFSSRYLAGSGLVGGSKGSSGETHRSVGGSTWSRSSSSGGSLLCASQERLAELATHQCAPNSLASPSPDPALQGGAARQFAELFIKALLGGHATWGSWPEIGAILAEDCEMITADDEVFLGRTAIIRRLNKGMEQFLKMIGVNGADQPAAEQLADLAGKVESAMEVEILSKKKGAARAARSSSSIVVVTYTFKFGMRRFKLQDRFKLRQGVICRMRRLRL